MKVREFIDKCLSELSEIYPKEEAKSLAIRVLQDMCKLPAHIHISDPEKSISLKESVLDNIIERLKAWEPVQYISGFEKFCGEKIKVGPGVLIPRPETEEMMGLIILSNSSVKSQRILDIGTGSGCIAWTLWRAFPKAEVYGCDISTKALQYAASQSIKRQSGETEGPRFFQCDVLSPNLLDSEQFREIMDKKFTIIVSNPPYITSREKEAMRPNVLNYEPAEALFVPDVTPLIFYRKIALLALDLLDSDGRLYFEVNELYAEDVAAMLGDLGFFSPQVVTDISGKPRFVRAVKN